MKIIRIVQYKGGKSFPEGVLMETTAKEACVLRRPDGTLAELVMLPKGETGADRQLTRLRDLTEFFGTKGHVAPLAANTARCVLALTVPYLTPLPGLPPRFALLESLLRLAVFVVLEYLASLTPSIRALYRYHGAEHKVNNCIRAGLPLTVENVRRQPTYARSCSNSAQAIQWLLSAFAVPLVRVDSLLLGTAVRLALLYAANRVGRWLMAWEHRREKPVFWLLAPGRLMQRLTAIEPGDGEIEVAIRAAELALGMRKREKVKGGTPNVRI